MSGGEAGHVGIRGHRFDEHRRRVRLGRERQQPIDRRAETGGLPHEIEAAQVVAIEDPPVSLRRRFDHVRPASRVEIPDGTRERFARLACGAHQGPVRDQRLEHHRGGGGNDLRLE